MSFLVSRMLLHRPAGKAGVDKAILLDRAARFQALDWLPLLAESRENTVGPRGAREVSDEQALERKVALASALVHLGEVSAARQALCASDLAPGTHETLETLRDPARRPSNQVEPLSRRVLDFIPAAEVSLDRKTFAGNLKRACKVSAGGPSGMTSDHLRVVLDDERCTDLLADAAEDLARAKIPDTIAQAVRLGRLTALQKDSGGLRGIVAGDVLRRLTARTLAMQHGDEM